MSQEEKINIEDLHIDFEIEEKEDKKIEELKDLDIDFSIKKPSFFLKKILFFFHYISASSIIFVILLFSFNASAYITLAKTWINPEELINKQEKMENLLSASIVQVSSEEVEDKDSDEDREKRFELLSKKTQETVKKDWLGAKNLIKDTKKIHLAVDITPYDNRIIIPKIGKNIPIVNVESYEATNSKDWSNIFMKELERGVIKYPGTANPGEEGNAFIFGHSSNFPWIDGNYNDVFALLDKVVYGDEIIVYFNQKKYVYSVQTKRVVKPGYVRALKDDKGKKQLSLMTCWPIGTTLNRLLLTAELKE